MTEHHTARPVDPKSVRYIKLGAHGGWEKECLDKGIVRIGFGSADNRKFQACQSGRWNDIRDWYRCRRQG